MKPLAPDPRSARLEVYYLPTEPAGWDVLTSTDAAPLRVPSKYTSLMTFLSDPQPLPR